MCWGCAYRDKNDFSFISMISNYIEISFTEQETSIFFLNRTFHNIFNKKFWQWKCINPEKLFMKHWKWLAMEVVYALRESWEAMEVEKQLAMEVVVEKQAIGNGSGAIGNGSGCWEASASTLRSCLCIERKLPWSQRKKSSLLMLEIFLLPQQKIFILWLEKKTGKKYVVFSGILDRQLVEPIALPQRSRNVHPPSCPGCNASPLFLVDYASSAQLSSLCRLSFQAIFSFLHRGQSCNASL